MARPDVRRVLELFAECKGKPSILYDYRPHLGSNRLPAVVKAIRRRIEALGGEIRFSCRVEDLDLAPAGGVRGLSTSSGYIPARVALLAIGHSARDTLAMLERRGVPMVQKPFQMGVRIEQPQEIVNLAGGQVRRAHAEERRSGQPITTWWPAARTICFRFVCAPAAILFPACRRRGLFAPTA